jgi:hypothetical protein
MARLFLFFLLLALLSGCVAPAPVATVTSTPFSTDTPQPSETPTSSPTVTETPTVTQTATATPNAEATKQAEFEAKKAEALKMVSIKLDSPEDFATLPVLDSKKFDNGEVQEAIYWIIGNVLPPVPENLKLPNSWRIDGDEGGFRWLDYVVHQSQMLLCEYRCIKAGCYRGIFQSLATFSSMVVLR